LEDTDLVVAVRFRRPLPFAPGFHRQTASTFETRRTTLRISQPFQ
jgi:hypothetical protein